MKLVSYIIGIIVISFLIAYSGIKLLKKNSWMIFIIETVGIIILTFFDILQHGSPYGNINKQLSSYFGDFNNFYLVFLPLIITTIIMYMILRKNINKQSKRV